MAKRGRKRKYKRYFDEPQEKAVVDYLNAKTAEERDQIYREYLAYPFFKMTESIILRYKLTSHKLDMDTLVDDTLSFLNTKLEKFDPSKGTKAYSYFGTVIKHYALGKRQKEQREIEKFSSFEARQEYIIHDEEYSYEMEEESTLMTDYFYDYIEIIKSAFEKHEDEPFLSETEKKMGYAVLELMENWEKVFHTGGYKYDKNQVLECLRNMTGFSTKEIRENLKFFKKIYYDKKNQKIDIVHKMRSNVSDDTPNQSNDPAS